MQSMLMVLNALCYQDYLFAEGGNGTTTQELSMQRAGFVVVQIPGDNG